MALTIAVGDELREIGKASEFSRFLNWVAAQPGASDGAFQQVLAVVPIEWEYSPDECTILQAELESLVQQGPQGVSKFIVDAWLRMARLAVREGRSLSFV